MTWVESVSPSFRARHESADTDDAHRLLHSLELTRERLEQVFTQTIGDLTVVLHRSVVSVSMTNPLLPLIWLATAPASRRYLAGWGGREELHVLAPAILAAHASSVPGSREMLALAPAALYSKRVIALNNPALRRVLPLRLRREVRWAWLLEGSARWFAGQTDHARPAIARRLRDGGRPSFPPGMRDAPLLGGTVIDLLVRQEGEDAAARLAVSFHPQGPRAALSEAFGSRSLAQTESAWRSHLTRWAG